MQCRFCKEEIIQGALVCRFCGKEQPVKAKPEKRKATGLEKTVMAVLLIALASFIGGGVYWVMNQPPETYQDIANRYARDCVDNKGYNNWRGSSGVTLETFCQLTGDAQALEQECKDQPEAC